MAKAQGWAGIVQMTNPINETDPVVNAYIETRSKTRRKAERLLENMAKSYYPMFREHTTLATSQLDASGAVMEAHIMDYKIDELICDDDIVSLAEEKATGVPPKEEAKPATPATPAAATPAAPVTQVGYSKPRKLFSDELISAISDSRWTYINNMRRVWTAPTGGTKA